MKIKKSNFIGSFVIVGILLALFGFYQLARAETEIINDFNANITIQKDGTLFVTEKIIYNFGSNQKHGIFRDIPITSVNGPQLNIYVSKVTNEFGEPYQYITSLTNNVFRIKIGDPNTLITGVKTYIISYQVYNAIRTFSDHDELYWNVTGNQWPVAIQNASALVTLPDFSISNVRMDCFTGPQGSTQKNCTFNRSGSNVIYSTTQPLNAKEGLTLVLGLTRGYINTTYVSPSQVSPVSNTSNSNKKFFSLFLPIFAIILIFIIAKIFTWQTNKTKPKPVIPRELKGQPVVVEYNPPDNLSPIEIGILLDRKLDITDISSVVIDLAVRGYLKIRYTVQKIKFWPDKKDFEFVKLKDGADLVNPADKIIFELLFNSRDSVTLSDLEEQKITFQWTIRKIQEDTIQYLYNKGYFDQAARDKRKKSKRRLSIVYAVLFILFFLFQYFLSELGSIFAALIFLILIILFLIIITAKPVDKLTPKGIATLKKILGFREFLQLTEKDKLQLLNAPELQPEMFEKFLPYAMVLGVEDKWAQKFEGIYNSMPKWYEDPTATSFNSYVLASNLILFNASFNKVFNITFRSSSSGFGGGGFSGGGSGGGGGRSW